MRRALHPAVPLLASLALALAAIGCAQPGPQAAPPAPPQVQPPAGLQVKPVRERTVYIAAVEPKGGANVTQEPYPDKPLPGGGGYLLKKPDDKGRWEVSTYRWDPGTIVVNQGERVTLEFIGINGDEHPFTIEGYWIKETVRRGHITRITFDADKPGIFKIICRSHSPAMQADLVVLEAR